MQGRMGKHQGQWDAGVGRCGKNPYCGFSQRGKARQDFEVKDWQM